MRRRLWRRLRQMAALRRPVRRRRNLEAVGKNETSRTARSPPSAQEKTLINFPNFNEPSRRRIDEAGAMLIAELSGWSVDRWPILLPTRASGYFHAADADLLLVPSSTGSREDFSMVSSVVRETRCDALIVRLSETAPAHVFCCVQIWKPGVVNWSIGKLWLSESGQGWIIPDPADTAEDDKFFRLQPGRLRACSTPPGEAIASPDAGFARADRLYASRAVA